MANDIRPSSGTRTLRERFGALRNLPPFLKLVWQTSPALTISTLLLRLVRALLPVATLFVGKLIIDEVVRLAQLPGAPSTPGGWSRCSTRCSRRSSRTPPACA